MSSRMSISGDSVYSDALEGPHDGDDQNHHYDLDHEDQSQPIDVDDEDEEEDDEDDEEDEDISDDDEEEEDEEESDGSDGEEMVMEVDHATGRARATTRSASSSQPPSRSSSASSILQRRQTRLSASRSATSPAGSLPTTSGGSSSAVAASSSSGAATAAAGGDTSASTGSGTNTGEGSSSSTGTAAPAPAKPANPVVDEKTQSELRRKILIIQSDPALSFAEKATSIQNLMSSRWQNAKRTTTDVEGVKDDQNDEPTEEDLRTTYNNADQTLLGCKHYRRGCKLKAACCGKWFNCRFCHDEACDHPIVRSDTKTILCMRCKTVQPASQTCISCEVRLARYYCDICKLWDDDQRKSIYHCHDCGICRIGQGLGNDFFHCKKCNICMVINLQDNHKCIERNLECDCPICGEFMFTSTTTVIFMPCGHCIHDKCHKDYIETSYQCPTCWKSLGNMKAYYARIDRLLEQQTMPAEYADYYSVVLCNDCEVKTEAAYHFLYHKCGKCEGYNTKVLQTFQRITNGGVRVVENAAETVAENGASSISGGGNDGNSGTSGNAGLPVGASTTGTSTLDGASSSSSAATSSAVGSSSSGSGSTSTTGLHPPPPGAPPGAPPGVLSAVRLVDGPQGFSPSGMMSPSMSDENTLGDMTMMSSDMAGNS